MNQTSPQFNIEPAHQREESALESISRAEVDMQITTALKYPRKLASVKQNMLSFATLDQETAESCFYSLPRGGKTIKGPSVRLAEIAVSCYGNLRVGSRAVSTVTHGDSPHVVVQAICHDLEKNVAVTIEKRRRIVGKKAKQGVIDEDDINLATNAGAAIAFRDAVFKVIPGALIKPVYEQAVKVAIGDAKTLGDRRVKAVEAFAKMGVSKERIFASLGKKSIEELNLEDLETLLGLFTAIKDGQTSIDTAFPEPEKKPEFKPKIEPKDDDGDLGPQSPPAAAQEPPKPESAPKAQETHRAPRGANATPQSVLEKVVTDGGFAFEHFVAWASATGIIKNPDSYAGFSDLPKADALKALQFKDDIIQALKEGAAQ